MEKLGHADSFRDLAVYKKSREVSREVFALSKRFPKEETYSLTDQARRSSRSIGAQIAEAWAKRRYEKHFISKLTDADGEQLETQHWIDTALDCEYINTDDASRLNSGLSEIGRMLNSMINKADPFASRIET
ncbi:MAG: four helix bundle protein [Deltaproteobacteria bacterium RIFOXYD12_FULL_50_9]|nr:MAG: four helix bundle protein [Deltaproteobacteria bacterium RIFOXYD12_FULL_50_9]